MELPLDMLQPEHHTTVVDALAKSFDLENKGPCSHHSSSLHESLLADHPELSGKAWGIPLLACECTR